MSNPDWSQLKMLGDKEQELKTWWSAEQEKQCA